MENVNIYAFADEAGKELEKQIAAMLRCGLQGLEIRGVDGENVSTISPEKAKHIRKALDDDGLVTWSIGSPIGKVWLHADWDAHLDKLRHTLEVANILGAENLRMFSFFMPKDEDPVLYRNQVIDRLGQMLEVAKGRGVALLHENEKGIYGDVARRCLDIHTQLPEMKGVFDPANFVQCGDDTLRGWELLKPYIRYLHIKDAMPDGCVVPAGKGAGNVAHIVKDYLARGGSAMTLEPHLRTFEGLKKLEEKGDVSAIGKYYSYPTADAAFDAACGALRELLEGL